MNKAERTIKFCLIVLMIRHACSIQQYYKSSCRMVKLQLTRYLAEIEKETKRQNIAK